jgi:tricorn protease
MRLRLLGIWLALALLPSGASAQTKLLRFPDLHGDRVVFTYAGDLWTAPSAGGTAIRLTASPGLELFAKFSPDGKWIAFTGQYDGDEQVYVIPSTGGVPRQLTFYPARGPFPPRWGYDNQVYGWSPDGKNVLYRSLANTWNLSESQIVAVPAAGGLGVPLPMPISGAGALSPDGKRIVYSPFARDFRTWKRYQGGWAQDLYIFDLATHEAKNITNNKRTDRDPMWVGDTIYFNSDRTGTLNLYAYDVQSAALKQLTHEAVWDVRWPSADNSAAASGQIVYELNGELNVLDGKSGASRHLSITVPTDAVDSRPSTIKVADNIEDAALSPKGERALFVARGDVFSSPIEKGVTRNLTRSSGVHDKGARWSPDGRKVAYLSDRTGEEELYLTNADGSGQAEQLTSGGKAMRFAPEWSPDGKRLAFSDKDGRIFVVTIADKKLTEIARNTRGFTTDYVWSPCGGFLAYTLTDASNLRTIWIWSVADGKARAVTDEMFYAGSPAWEPKGQYLYFLSAHSYAPQLDPLDFNWVMNRNVGVYALALRKDAPNPFPPEDDKVTLDDEKKKDGDAKDAKDEKDKGKDAKDAKKEEPKKDAPPVYTKIDWDGLMQRVATVPVPADNYDGLVVGDGRLLYTKSAANFYGREPEAQPELRVFTFKDRKVTTLAERVNGYTLSRDAAKVLVVQSGQFNVYDASASGKDSKKTIDTGGLVVDRVPQEEWAEVFHEAWRRYRDYFYVPNMNGYDWAAIGKRYESWLPYVAHRSDLSYVIGEMIAEVNSSHAYVAGGDVKLPPRPRVALPGCRFELDKTAPGGGRYRIAAIFAGQNEEDNYRSPLTEVGVDAKVGDYVLAIDGVELAANDSPYRLLRYKSDRAVRLTLNAKPAMEGSREVTFRPIDSEADLVYLQWVNGNREKVAKMSGGKIGYIHIPDMGGDGLREFIKTYFPQVRKEGLVVDVRENGGGNVSQTLLERLGRKLLTVDYARTTDDPAPYPTTVFHGHMACLINQGSASDGDIFPHMFRLMGLGPLIGTRTWGGVVGISGHGPLVDGTQIFVPEFATVSLDGQYVIEGEGVHPDIEIDNDAKSVLEGRDPQLERAVAEIQKKMAAEPKKLPARPAPPVRTQDGKPQGPQG